MPFIRITTLQGLLTAAEKQSIAEGLTLAIMKIETGGLDTPQFRAISALAFEEIASGNWFVGGQPAEDDPAALVEIRVPEGAVDDARREAMAKAVENVLSANSEAFGKTDGHRILWTHLLEIKDGNWGARGRMVKLEEIKRIAGGAPTAN
ncbi:hypothetical protein L3V16_03255 [Brucella ciceri]|uniref:4-oxalocrotonate tautomerase n=1 Tax=Ochrobactrum sp. PW1 TaxID=1882222 RepID=A0A292GKR9_9HYPH|nr:tautomerase family protein [Brucella ciceri]MCH6202850.1 hypothetical protein [Brucella ciceri]BBA73543.1 4-oxalocrotonate tautomerase [Ochrobactrum sp. PW1]